MIRSNFAITRLLVLPYGALLLLYLLVVGGGGGWLYLQMREVETRLLIDEINTAVAVVADKLATVDAITLMEQHESWLVTDIQGLFVRLPSLRNVSVRDQHRGVEMISTASGTISSQATPSLPADAKRANIDVPATQRLHASSDALFYIRFDLAPEAAPLVRLDFAFDRLMMLASVDEGVSTLKRAIQSLALIGGVGILVALAITLFAMRMTRQVEGHFQELYHRASMAEIAAQLVHDLRSPLMVLRTNVKALLVTPDQTREIVDELDRDIVTMNNRLSAFLNLTQQHDDTLEPVDFQALVNEAVRLAEPVMAQHGLRVETDIPPDLPWPMLQKSSMRDALLNVLLNAGQSGQKYGIVQVKARQQNGFLMVTVEDQGEGIADKDLPHLFDPYFTTRTDGTGLGLAIVRRIVTAHQGEVHAENRPQGGARIVFRLPLQQKEIPHWWKSLKKIFPA